VSRRLAVVVAALLLGTCGVVVGLAMLQQPPYDELGEAVRDLGPISGWRCAEQTASYVYEPRHGGGDAALFDEPPEAAVARLRPGFEVERVEVNLRSGETVVWTTVPTQGDDGNDGTDAGGQRAQRVFVLAPGRLRAVSLNRNGTPVPVCDSHLGDWQIIGEHALG
jgi:hypothetical protein